MVFFIKVEKDGNLKQEKIEDINNLFKKCGFRKNDNFEKTFSKENYDIWGRINGKEDNLNNYSFFLQNSLSIYGKGAIIKMNNGKLEDLNIEEWLEFNNKKNEDNKDSESIDLDINDNEDSEESEESGDTYQSSELKEEDYVYSSEEDNL